jgi:hypothetical protein
MSGAVPLSPVGSVRITGFGFTPRCAEPALANASAATGKRRIVQRRLIA